MVDDMTDHVQGFIARGEAIPAGEYWCPEGITVTDDYESRAAATGRQPAADGCYWLGDSSGPVLIRSRYGSMVLGSVRASGLQQGDAVTLVGPKGAMYWSGGIVVSGRLAESVAGACVYCGR